MKEWRRFTYMLSALAAHTREGSMWRARVDDNGYALRRSTYPKIGVVYSHALEQRSLCPVQGVDNSIGEMKTTKQRSLTCRYSFQTAFSVLHSKYLWPHQGSGAAEVSATSLWGRGNWGMTTTMMIMILKQMYCLRSCFCNYRGLYYAEPTPRPPLQFWMDEFLWPLGIPNILPKLLRRCEGS